MLTSRYTLSTWFEHLFNSAGKALAPRPKIAVGSAIIIAAIALALFVFSGSCDRAEELSESQRQVPTADLTPPIDDALLGWESVELDVAMTLDPTSSTLTWRDDSDNVLLRGPTIGDAPLEWSHHQIDQWQLLRSTYDDGAASADLLLWSHPGAPTAILEVQIAETDPLSSDLPPLHMHMDPDEAEALDTAATIVGTDPSELSGQSRALRASLSNSTLGLAWPGGPPADLHHETDELRLSWPLEIPPSPWADKCDDLPSTAGHERSFFITFEYGDDPLLSTSPPGLSPEATAAPLFIDPPTLTDDPWIDGRARHAGDLALRLRALAFGHSDRDDPRYGNGGLLGAGLHATFAVPARWWDDPDIQALRRSLNRRPIDVIPIIADGDPTPESSLALFEDPCQALTNVLDAETATRRALLLDQEQSSPTPLSAPLSPLTFIGIAPSERPLLLEHLFGDGPESLFSSTHDTHAMAIPLVSTRNPLEDVWSNNLLQPERQGHWTLHEELTRQLTRWELEQAPGTHSTASIQSFERWSFPDPDDHPWWHSDDSLFIDHIDSQTLLLGLGDLPHPGRSAILFPSDLSELSRNSPAESFAIK